MNFVKKDIVTSVPAGKPPSPILIVALVAEFREPMRFMSELI